MTPVIILSDGYIANGSEPWRIPKFADLPPIPISHPGPRSEEDPPFMPYRRDEMLARPWAIPGTPGLMHRVGGLEKQDVTGNVNYDPENHQHMVHTRAKKTENVALVIEPQAVNGPEEGDLLVLSWGGTYGACKTAVELCQEEGLSVAHAHLRWVNPFPRNLGELLKNYKKVLIPELNMGQLRMLVRAKYLIDAVGLNKIKGRPFDVVEVADKIREMITGKPAATNSNGSAMKILQTADDSGG
jgi:2-oxoglutarate ferredoxin oxidoreductase subunit alpha